MRVEFAYAQARAQARHGERMQPGDWRLLEASHGLGRYLHAARAMVIARRVQHFSAATSPHAVERSLRRDWRAEVNGAARWVPREWRAAVGCTAWLPNLPALAHLAAGGRVLPWMQDDPVLASLAVDDPDSRRLAIEESAMGVLVERGGSDLLGAWLTHWQSSCPASAGARDGLHELAGIVSEHLAALGNSVPSPVAMEDHRDRLEARTIRLLRTRLQQPVTVFCHLLLTGIEIWRLRDGLVRRALFNDVAPELEA